VDDPEQTRQIEETARWFGTPLLIHYQNLTPGLLPSEAERLGKISVGTELGWGKAVQIDGVRYGRHGVLAAAIRHGQLRGQIEPIGHHLAGTQIKAAMVDRECFTVAPFQGHFEPLIDCGQRVRRGDIVGLLHDFDHIDREPFPCPAGVDGIIIAQAWAAPVQRGQHIIVVGRIVE
jgi:N-alpha-acetyl-L-2,4-diaminobutyrate deacetylase